MKDEHGLNFITMRGCWCSMRLLCRLSSTGSREVFARFDWCAGPALPPQRSANGVPLHSSFSLIATGASRWEGWQEDDSPSPDTGQLGCVCYLWTCVAQCRRVGWRERFLADFSCPETLRPRSSAWRHLPALVWQLRLCCALFLRLPPMHRMRVHARWQKPWSLAAAPKPPLNS